MASKYYSGDPAKNAGTALGFAIYPGYLTSSFLGFNLLTNASADNAAVVTFSGKSTTAVPGYFIGSTPTQVYGYKLENLRKSISQFTTVAHIQTGQVYTNSKSYPTVVYLQAIGPGGSGGTDSSADSYPYGAGGGGGSGYHNYGYVVLQPGDSLSLSIATAASHTKVTAKLATSSQAYTSIGGVYVNNNETLELIAAPGYAGGTNLGGNGFRNGGNQGNAGGSMTPGTESIDGYASTASNEGGRAASNGGGGGGAAPVLTGSGLGNGGAGARFSGYTAIHAEYKPGYGAGGGGNACYYYSGSYKYAAASQGSPGAGLIYSY